MLRGRGVLAVVAVGDDEVRPTVAVEVCQLERRVAHEWVFLKNHARLERALAVVEKHVHRLEFLRDQRRCPDGRPR